MIARCTCTHAYQDKKYGRKLRVHTEGSSNKSAGKKSCTVCGSVK